MRAGAWDLAALALFAALALALHAPILPHLTTHVPADPGDPLLNTWILWWNTQAAPWSANYWNAPAFAPSPNALALSETLLGLTPFTTPVQWLGGSPLLAYNLFYVLTSFLNGASAFVLARALTGRSDAALVGALAFMFAPYRAAQLPHVQTLATFFMPLALVGLHQYWKTGRAWWLVCLFAATVMNGLVSGYHLVYFAVPLGLACLWITASDTTSWRRPFAVVGTLAAALVAMLPVLLPYLAVHERWNLHRGIGEMQLYSADITSFLSGARHLWWRPLPTLIDIPEADVYPGLAVLACLALGVVAWRQSAGARIALPSSPRPIRVLRGVLTAVAAIAALTALMGAIAGPFALGFGPLEVSVTSLNKPLGAALSAMLMVGVLSPGVRASASRGSLVGLYVAIAVVATILMLGPEGRFLGHRFWYKAPSAWLLEVPGFNTVRVPARWAIIQFLATSMLAAMAFAAWQARQRATQAWLTVAISVALIADGWYRLPVVPVPLPLDPAPQADLVVELPTHGWTEDTAAMYHGIAHHRPVVNGYSGYAPPHWEALATDMQALCLDSLNAVRGGRSLDVVVDTRAYLGEEALAAVRAQWPAAPESVSGQRVTRHVPATSQRSATAYDDPIDLSSFCLASRENTPKPQ